MTALLSTDQLADITGASFRQIDYWHREKMITCGGGRGSGSPRRWHPDIIPIVRTLADLSAALGPRRSMHDLLRAVAAHHQVGRLDLDGGITITWPVYAEPRIPA